MPPQRCCSSPRTSRRPRSPAARAGWACSPMRHSASSAASTPACLRIALERATALLKQIAGGEAGPVQVDACGRTGRGARGMGRLAPQPPGATAGRRCARQRGAMRSWRPSRDRVEPEPQGWRVRRPPHRFDVRIEADLIEEVARLRGFDRIAESRAIAPQVPRTCHRIEGAERPAADRDGRSRLPRGDHLQLRRPRDPAAAVSGHTRPDARQSDLRGS